MLQLVANAMDNQSVRPHDAFSASHNRADSRRRQQTAWVPASSQRSRPRLNPIMSRELQEHRVEADRSRAFVLSALPAQNTEDRDARFAVSNGLARRGHRDGRTLPPAPGPSATPAERQTALRGQLEIKSGKSAASECAQGCNACTPRKMRFYVANNSALELRTSL